MNYLRCFHYLTIFVKQVSGGLGTEVFLQLLGLDINDSGVYVSYQQLLLTRVLSEETSTRESPRNILKVIFSSRRGILKYYLLGILEQK